MSFKREVVINAPIEEVFRVLSTLEYAPHVLSHIAGVEQIGSGEVKVGTKFKETRNISKTQVENILEVTEYQPHSRFATHSEQNGLDLDYKYHLTEVDGGTKVDFEGQITAKGIRNKIVKPLISRIIEKEDGFHLDRLKEYIVGEED